MFSFDPSSCWKTLVKQNKTAPGEGNCTEACIATILNLPLESVCIPWSEDQHWAETLDQWLGERGYGLCLHDDWPIFGGPVLIVGVGPRGRNHMVVGVHGEVFHDPHPENLGLVSETHYFTIGLRFG